MGEGYTDCPLDMGGGTIGGDFLAKRLFFVTPQWRGATKGGNPCPKGGAHCGLGPEPEVVKKTNKHA